MPAIQASRRLVKSPPELWAEVSDAASLARHLGEVGEITITRLEPETTVAWEGEHASGTVELAPAGWGTSVTLTAEPVEAAAAAEPRAPKPTPAPAPEPEAKLTAEAKPLATAEPEPTPEPAATGDAEPASEPPAEPGAAGIEEPAPIAAPPRRTWLARLFRRRTQEPTAAAEPAPTPKPEPSAAPADRAGGVPGARELENADRAGGVAEDDSATPLAESPRATTGPARSSADPERKEPPAGEPKLEAALNQALDSLGQAHHRPFSRG